MNTVYLNQMLQNVLSDQGLHSLPLSLQLLGSSSKMDVQILGYVWKELTSKYLG